MTLIAKWYAYYFQYEDMLLAMVEAVQALGVYERAFMATFGIPSIEDITGEAGGQAQEQAERQYRIDLLNARQRMIMAGHHKDFHIAFIQWLRQQPGVLALRVNVHISPWVPGVGTLEEVTMGDDLQYAWGESQTPT